MLAYQAYEEYGLVPEALKFVLAKLADLPLHTRQTMLHLAKNGRLK